MFYAKELFVKRGTLGQCAAHARGGGGGSGRRRAGELRSEAEPSPLCCLLLCSALLLLATLWMAGHVMRRVHKQQVVAADIEKMW
jgi:hypothetical protein